MKKIKKYLVLSAILAGIFGASLQKNKEVIKTEASPITQGTTLYLEPNSEWQQNNERFAAYFFGDGNKWVDMTPTSLNSPIYKVTVPDTSNGFTNVIFARMNGGTTENNWENKWDQTIDLDYNDPNNLFTITHRETGENSDKNKFKGTWSQARQFTPTTRGITSAKARIWLDRSGHYSGYNDGYEFAMKIGTTYYQPSGYEKAINSPERLFAFYDLPLTALNNNPSVELVVLRWGVKQEIVVSAGTYNVRDNNKIWKVDYVNSNWSVSKGPSSDRLDAEFIARVLEGYLTCSNSAENGYNAFPDIEENFINNWNVNGNLSDFTVKDYTGTGTGGYSVDRGSGVSINAYSKYVALERMYDSQGVGDGVASSTHNNQQTLAPAIIIALLGIMAIAGYYFLDKKKVVNN